MYQSLQQTQAHTPSHTLPLSLHLHRPAFSPPMQPVAKKQIRELVYVLDTPLHQPTLCRVKKFFFFQWEMSKKNQSLPPSSFTFSPDQFLLSLSRCLCVSVSVFLCVYVCCCCVLLLSKYTPRSQAVCACFFFLLNMLNM